MTCLCLQDVLSSVTKCSSNMLLLLLCSVTVGVVVKSTVHAVLNGVSHSLVMTLDGLSLSTRRVV